MTAERLMDTNPVVMRDTDTIGAAVDQLMNYRFRSLPVVDEDGRFQGMVGVNCMLKLVIPKAATMNKGLESLPYVSDSLEDMHERLQSVTDQPVTICLDENVPVVYPDTPMLETLLTLYRTKAALGVVDKATKRLVGVISYFDVGERIVAAETRPNGNYHPPSARHSHSDLTISPNPH